MRTSFYLRPCSDKRELERLARELDWLVNKISSVKANKLPRKPGAVREIRDLEYQARRNELTLTFHGPEWAKYEKYGVWELLN